MTHAVAPRLLKTLLPFAALATLAGCVSLGNEPPPTLLTLTATAAPAEGDATTGTERTALTVLEPSAPQRLAITRVPVQIDDANIAYLKDAVWVEKPTRLFRRLLSETVRARTGRVVIDGFDATIATEDQLRGSLVEFGYDARSSSVVVVFDALRDAEGNRIVSRRFRSTVPGIAAEAGPVGDALNRAANDVAGQVAEWIAQ